MKPVLAYLGTLLLETHIRVSATCLRLRFATFPALHPRSYLFAYGAHFFSESFHFRCTCAIDAFPPDCRPAKPATRFSRSLADLVNMEQRWSRSASVVSGMWLIDLREPLYMMWGGFDVRETATGKVVD